MPLPIRFPGVFSLEAETGRGIVLDESWVAAFIVRPVGPAEESFTSTSIEADPEIRHATGGPVDEPVELSSLSDFERVFGSVGGDDPLGWGVHQFFVNGGEHACVLRLVTGGLGLLDSVDRIGLLVLPGVFDAGLLGQALTYGRRRRAFALFDSPVEATSVVALLGSSNDSSVGPVPRSELAAMYFPWLDVDDPRRPGTRQRVPPSGSVAGMYARNDATIGVWRTPVGGDGRLTGVSALAFEMTDEDERRLASAGINGLRARADGSASCRAARTLDDHTNDRPYRSIAIRRLSLLIERNLQHGLGWVGFEPNDEPLWKEVRARAGDFMQGLFRRGAFAGQMPEQAWFVTCGHQTTSSDDIARGQVNLVVGFAPLMPSEFTVMRLTLAAIRPEPQ